MDQRAINSAEWENPGNWTGPKWLSLYASGRDSRLWVPKQIPALGWTINLSHKRGNAWLAGVLLGALGFVVITNIVMIRFVL